MIKRLILLGMIASALGGPSISGQQARAFEVFEVVKESPAVLVLTDELSGNIFIRDREGKLVVELNKPLGNRVEVGLDEGEYTVVNIWEGDAYESAIALCHGDILELTPGMFLTEGDDRLPPDQTPVQPQKETLMRGRFETHITGGFDIRTTRVFDEYSVLLGGNIGLTLNHHFTIGIAGYSRALRENGFFDLNVDIDAGNPSYGGLVLGYSFFPLRKVHFHIETLLGGGDSWQGSFAIVEPRIDLVLNITQIVRLRFGLAAPFTNRKRAGLETVMLNFGIQFGK